MLKSCVCHVSPFSTLCRSAAHQSHSNGPVLRLISEGNSGASFGLVGLQSHFCWICGLPRQTWLTEASQRGVPAASNCRFASMWVDRRKILQMDITQSFMRLSLSLSSLQPISRLSMGPKIASTWWETHWGFNPEGPKNTLKRSWRNGPKRMLTFYFYIYPNYQITESVFFFFGCISWL